MRAEPTPTPRRSLVLLLALAACRPASPPDESPPGDSSAPWTGHSGGSAQTPELIISFADGQEVQRIDRDRGVAWTWNVQDDFPGFSLKPHGLELIEDRVYVVCFDYFTDSMVVALDADTGALLEAPIAGQDLPWGGEPGLLGLRAPHNLVRHGETWLVSDTHNHRILALDAGWDYAWELSEQSALGEPALQSRWSHPNDVSVIEVDGEEQLLVSARGDNFNHVLRFAPAQGLRPQDPPWELVARYPQANDPTLLFQNHNPTVLPDGRGLLIPDSGHDRIVAVSWQGEELWSLPERGCEQGLDWPRDAAWGPEGTLYIADTLNDRVIEVSTGGCVDASTTLWSREGSRPYQVLVLP